MRDTSTRHDIRGTVYGSVSAIGAPLNVFSMLFGTWLAGRYGVEKVYAVGGILAMLSMFAIVLTGTFSITHETAAEQTEDNVIHPPIAGLADTTAS
ncbi:MAG: hypothetical protein ACOYL3_04175 [Desulfuromonadaceae bacterium]